MVGVFQRVKRSFTHKVPSDQKIVFADAWLKFNKSTKHIRDLTMKSKRLQNSLVQTAKLTDELITEFKGAETILGTATPERIGLGEAMKEWSLELTNSTEELRRQTAGGLEVLEDVNRDTEAIKRAEKERVHSHVEYSHYQEKQESLQKRKREKPGELDDCKRKAEDWQNRFQEQCATLKVDMNQVYLRSQDDLANFSRIWASALLGHTRNCSVKGEQCFNPILDAPPILGQGSPLFPDVRYDPNRKLATSVAPSPCARSSATEQPPPQQYPPSLGPYDSPPQPADVHLNSTTSYSSQPPQEPNYHYQSSYPQQRSTPPATHPHDQPYGEPHPPKQ